MKADQCNAVSPATERSCTCALDCTICLVLTAIQQSPYKDNIICFGSVADVALRALCMGRSKVPVWEKTADTLGMRVAVLRLGIPLGNPTLGVQTPLIPRDASGLSCQTRSDIRIVVPRAKTVFGRLIKPPRAPPTPGGQGKIEWDPHG